jgi:3-hydroxyacyl-[acyl-carrier-protein] dehydratase
MLAARPGTFRPCRHVRHEMPMTDTPSGSHSDTASTAEILRHIPHRYPFIMIDRMVSCVEGKSVRCIKNVTATEWFFEGANATTGVMPSMLLVEALAQSSGALSHYSGLMKHMSKPIIFFAGIDQCVFGRDVRIGDTVGPRVHADPGAARRDQGEGCCNRRRRDGRRAHAHGGRARHGRRRQLRRGRILQVVGARASCSTSSRATAARA